MKFDYESYRELLRVLRGSGYEVRDYHTFQDAPKCVILRHDVDMSVPCALELARVEAEAGARATYFVMVTSGLYNPASPQLLRMLRQIRQLGHEIGLHYDETAYEDGFDNMPCHIRREADYLGQLIGCPVTAVSMHRPSRRTLDADVRIPGMINSYGSTFFRDFKYLSDSRCHWKEPVIETAAKGHYPRLHILTHPIWYASHEKSMAQTLDDFVGAASAERYAVLSDNITDLASVLPDHFNFRKARN